jgi:hypothetical protein
MTDSISFKRGDTAAVVRATLYADDAGTTPVDLTGATVKFFMVVVPGVGSSPAGLKVNGTCTILNAAAGQVGYDWITADVDTAATYKAEFQVTYASGKIQTFPRTGYLTVVITEDLD